MASSHPLASILAQFQLVEAECWALLHLTCLELRRSLITLCSLPSTSLLQIAEAVLVTPSSLILQSTGQVEVRTEVKQNITQMLPKGVGPLGDLTIVDWQRIGLHSVAQLLAASLLNQRLSREMVMFLDSIVGQDLASIPPLSDVLIFLRRKIKPDSAARLVASLCYKLEGMLAADSRSLDRRFAASDTRLRLSSSSPLRSRLTTSCPSLSNREQVLPSTQSIENLMNNNDLFSLLELPGLKFSKRRTNHELSLEQVRRKKLFVPSFLEQREAPPVRVSLMTPGRTCGQVVRVSLPTGQRLEFTLDKMRVRVKELLTASLDRMRVRPEVQQPMFGLFMMGDDGELLYLDMEAPMVHYLSKGVLSLQLRFLHKPDYPDLCPQLQQLLYLQLRQDVLRGGLSLGSNQAVQLALLALQAECESPDLFRVQPEHLLPPGADAATRRFLERNQSILLTSSRELAQGLFCETLLSLEECCSFQYSGRETRAEASRGISLHIHSERFQLMGQSFTWDQLRQLSYSQSYLQLLVKVGQELKRLKVFFPGERSRCIHDLMATHAKLKMEKRRVKTEGRKRCSLGVVCSQIVEVAKEVSKSIRTPKRSRSLSLEAGAGGKRRRLSLVGRASQTPQKFLIKTPVKSSASVGKAARTMCLSPPPPPLPPHAPSRPPPAVPSSSHRVRGQPPHDLRGEDKENVRTGVRMGTRTMGRTRKRSSEEEEEERRILQVEVRREQVAPDSVSISGHGISVTGRLPKSPGEQLQAGDRILALNGVSVEEVSLETFWRILYSYRGPVRMIISRPV